MTQIMEGQIIEMFVKPFNRERFEQKEEAKTISLQQRNCTHSLQIDEEIDQHNCDKCGKLFTSHNALLYVLHNRELKIEIQSYNLRNEIHFLTEKIEALKYDIKHLQKERRTIVKLNK